MKNNFDLKNVFIFLFIIGCLSCVLFIPKLLKNKNDGYKDGTNHIIVKDSYKVNEFIPVYVNDQQMSIKYLHDFISILIEDIDNSYDMIDKDYRDKKFGSLKEYRNYIDSLEIPYDDTVSKYATYELNGYKYYDIYDRDGHRFIFKTEGVMQYKVLFDTLDDGDDE